jgi:hypothetical protein
MFTTRLPAFLTVLAVLSVGCRETVGNEEINPADLTTTVVSGDSQNGVLGSALPDSIVITVVDSHGQPVQDLTLDWRTLSADGQVGAARTVTDPAGRTANTWTLGTASGEQQLEVRVVLRSKSVSLETIRAESYPRAAEVRSDPAGRAFEVGETFQFTATVRDETGTLIPDYPIRWLSTNPAAASVDQRGNVIALQATESVTIIADALGTRRGMTAPVYDLTVRFESDSLYLTRSEYVRAKVTDMRMSSSPRSNGSGGSIIIDS